MSSHPMGKQNGQISKSVYNSNSVLQEALLRDI